MMPSPSAKSRISLPATILVCLLVSALFYVGIMRLDIDTDVIRSMPTGDPVLSDARAVIRTHPMQNQVIVDLFHPGGDPKVLVEAGQWVQHQMTASGLFQQVGMDDIRELIPDLLRYVATHLPMLFSDSDIETIIKPRLTDDAVRRSLEAAVAQLSNLDSIGQAELLALDPLGLRSVVLARLIHLAPSQEVNVFKGFLLSKDQRHLLLLAKPHGSGTDTTHAKKISRLMEGMADALQRRFASLSVPVKFTPFGAYRAALDNERTAKRDVRLMIALATIGIAMLMFVAFPRPYIGLLALLPAIAGTGVAVFVYALMHRSISVLTLGFGGAIISITVDHGIAYLLFLDRPHGSTGRQAAREIWAIGLLATLTTVGAFSILALSRFAVLSQIGQFAALGIAFSFLFVHTLFPLMMPSLAPAEKERSRWLQQALYKIAHWGGNYKVWGAGAVALGMLFFARPQFDVDFRSMNTVSKDTAAAEKWISGHWGNLSDRVYLMAHASSIQHLQDRCDDLLEIYEEATAGNILAAAFSPSMIFPGRQRSQQNFHAWRRFWDPAKVQQFKTTLVSESTALGFTPFAFDAFIATITSPMFQKTELPRSFFPLMGVVAPTESSATEPVWTHWSILTPGSAYEAERFIRQTADQQTRLFDPRHFSIKLGEALKDTFLKMVAIIAASVVVLVFLFFLDWKVSLVTLAPVAFAFVCTLGTLNLIGHPLGIPGLMLSIIVIGMGIDYALFFVRAHQRYRDDTHPSVGLIRLAVFLASASTLVGFGALITADHQLLNSAGLTCFIGVAYALIGAYALLPPLLNRLFTASTVSRFDIVKESPAHFQPLRLRRYYRHMEAVVRLQVWWRLRTDPVFAEFKSILPTPASLFVYGIGYGELVAYLLEAFPHLDLVAADRHPERVRIARRIVGDAATVECIPATAIGGDSGNFDVELLLDGYQQLTDSELTLMLERLRFQLKSTGRLIMRAQTIPMDEALMAAGAQRSRRGRHSLFGNPAKTRSTRQMQSIIEAAGFSMLEIKPSGNGRKGFWFIAGLESKPA